MYVQSIYYVRTKPMNDHTFNRDSGVPLYAQLKNYLMQRIHSGEWAEGCLLPTEYELKEQYGLSRATIRQALDEMEREGVIERRRGVGTRVSHRRIQPELMKLTSFSDDMLSRGLTPESKTLEIDFAVPPPKVREALKLEPNEKIWCVRRLRLANGEPYGIHDLYIPPTLEFSPRELTSLQSYYRLLEQRHQLKPAYANETLTASVANKSEAALLKTPENSPLLVIWRVTYAENDQALETVKIIYRADRYEYHIQLYV